MSAERRKYPRADVDFDVKYSEEKDPEQLFGKNICAGGMAFRTRSLIPAGTVLNLVLTTPDSHSEIKARVRVVRAWSENDEFLAGSEFFEINTSDKRLLGKLVENYLAREATSV